MSTSTLPPSIAALVAMFKADASDEELAQVIGVLVESGSLAGTESSRKSRKSRQSRQSRQSSKTYQTSAHPSVSTTPNGVNRVKSLCRSTRSAFIAAARADGHDFTGWSSRRIAEHCVTTNYSPAGFRIGERYTEMFGGDAQSTQVETLEPSDPEADTPASNRHVTQRLRGKDGRYLPSRQTTRKIPPESIVKMEDYCREIGVAPIGEAWTLLCEGERRARVLRAANKRDGITPPEV